MNNTPPAEGERRAITGYRAQYRLAALYMLKAMRNDTLNWVQVADPSAGRVDDIIIGIQNRIDAYQVKWSLYSGSFTFNELVSPSDTKPCLIKQLADGWLQLSKDNPGYRVVVHLVSNNIPSTHDLLPFDIQPPPPRHFSAFLSQVWNQFKKGLIEKSSDIPDNWQKAWLGLQNASGLNEQEFNQFVKDCELDFGQGDVSKSLSSTRDSRIHENDLNRLTQVLIDIVADPSRIVKLTREELLLKLGWEDRFEYRSKHEFPCPEFGYQPIETTSKKLNDALDTLRCGYILVIGSPGSGKSTLLTQVLQERNERIVRYYAYVPDSQDPFTLRGESTNFLHDIVLSIEQLGFRVGSSISRFDRDQLLERLHSQLSLLNEDFKSTGRKTIFLIDGLDHITREQRPNRSLLTDLPVPEQLSDGIIFLLGSQTDIVLPDRIQASVRQVEKRIEMQQMSKESVYQIITDLDSFAEITEKQKSKIYELSDGHPLALSYILNRIKGIQSNELDVILENEVTYEGTIESIYQSYWNQLARESELIHLLGVICRLRKSIDLSWIEGWESRATVEKLRQNFSHYFRKENHHRWYFFHNSFRLFLLERTSESSPGAYDPDRDHSFHKYISEQCLKAPADSSWRWEVLYHLSQAGDDESVISTATQEWFRSQVFNLRPFKSVSNDIKIALRSVERNRDPIALCRLIMSGAEIELRKFNLDSIDYLPLLLRLGESLSTIENLRDGNHLLVNLEFALDMCIDLLRYGFADEARRIFTLSEPLHILRAEETKDDSYQHEIYNLLLSWADATSYFRDIPSIIGIIRNLKYTSGRPGTIDKNLEVKSVQNSLLFRVALSLIYQHRWKEFGEIEVLFDLKNSEAYRLRFILINKGWREFYNDGDPDAAKEFFHSALSWINEGNLKDEEKVALAEGYLFLLRDTESATRSIANISQPELRTRDIRTDDGINPFMFRFRLSRLQYILGSKRKPNEIIPDPSNQDDLGIAYFERGICTIARIWADAWTGNIMDQVSINHMAYPLIRLFDKGRDVTNSWTSWYYAQQARTEFYQLLIEAVSSHGADKVETLCSLFEQEWDNPDTSRYWSADIRREAIMALYGYCQDHQWCLDHIDSLEEWMLEGMDIDGRINEYLKQATVYADLNEVFRARTCLNKMLNTSIGVGYRKDYQLNTWIEWLKQINEEEPDFAFERIEWFAHYVKDLENSTEGRATKSAAEDLLDLTLLLSPDRAVQLFEWFIDEGMITHESGTKVILRALIRSESVPSQVTLQTLVKYLLPISKTEDSLLISSYISKLVSSGKPPDIREDIKYFLMGVDVSPFKSTRTSWRRSLARSIQEKELPLEEFGLAERDLFFSESDEWSGHQLKLVTDEKPLFLSEVKVRVKSAASLIDLKALEREDSHFEWDKVLEGIIDELNANDIDRLSEIFLKNKRNVPSIALLCMRLKGLGFKDRAWSLGIKGLGDSPVYGWDRSWDGGSKQSICSALLFIDQIKARQLVYKQLIDDMCDHYWYPQNMALNLYEIITLLVDEMPIKELWIIIEEYVRQLFSHISSVSEFKFQPIDDRNEDTVYSSLLKLILRHLDHPVAILSHAAMRTTAKLIILKNKEIEKEITNFNRSDTGWMERLMNVFLSVCGIDPKLLKPYETLIIDQAYSPNYLVRSTAVYISERLDLQISEKKPTILKTPAMFTFHLKREGYQSIEDFANAEIYEALPDTNNPQELVAPFNEEIALLAKIARIPQLNLCYRIVQIMQDLSVENELTEKHEKELRWKLEASDLQYTYRRPRARLARRAIHHVLAELLDFGIIDRKNIQNIFFLFRTFDPALLMSEPESRPQGIISLKDTDEHWIRVDEWIDRTEDASAKAFLFEMADWIIIGESTIIKRLEWEVPTETRVTATWMKSSIPNDFDDPIRKLFQTSLKTILEEYYHEKFELIGALIVKDSRPTSTSPGHGWIALNPMIAHQLEWKPNSDKLFAWENDAGCLMVQSVWWKDGETTVMPPHPDEEVGEGWIVMATKEAVSLLKNKYGVLNRLSLLERSYLERGMRRPLSNASAIKINEI